MSSTFRKLLGVDSCQELQQEAGQKQAGVQGEPGATPQRSGDETGSRGGRRSRNLTQALRSRGSVVLKELAASGRFYLKPWAFSAALRPNPTS